jgi:hypothetical protein
MTATVPSRLVAMDNDLSSRKRTSGYSDDRVESSYEFLVIVAIRIFIGYRNGVQYQ